jgi:hypothetical protein
MVQSFSQPKNGVGRREPLALYAPPWQLRLPYLSIEAENEEIFQSGAKDAR